MRAQSISALYSTAVPRPRHHGAVRQIVLSRLRNYYRRRLNDWFLGRFSFLTLRDGAERSAERPCRKTDGRHKGQDGLASTIVPARDIIPPVGGTQVFSSLVSPRAAQAVAAS